MGGIAKEGMISGAVSLTLTDSIELMPGISIAAARPKNAGRTNLLGTVDKPVQFKFATNKTCSELELIGDGGTRFAFIDCAENSNDYRYTKGKFLIDSRHD